MSQVIATREGGKSQAVATLKATPVLIAAGIRGPRGANGTSFKVDATGLLSSRGTYDGEDPGFVFLATDAGELYVREGGIGWSLGVPFRGADGLSAYAVAVVNGFVGTEADWLAFLQGADGADGAAGADGATGAAGRGITAASINGSGHLLLNYSDLTQDDLGLVVGATGAAGADGATGSTGAAGRGITSVAINGSSHLIITYSDATTEDAGLIAGGGSGVWGAITGALADQTDLQAALNGKATAAQGALAATAVQPGALGTAAYQPTTAFATAAQGTKADAAIPAAEKGAASGVATLDGSSKIPLAQLPAIAITDTAVVASQAAMLALTAQTGDVAIRTDISTSFILRAEPPTTLSNWEQLLSPAAGGGAAVGSATPQALGTATPGVSTSASREDHVHQMPSAADVGAAPSAHTHNTDDLTEGSTNLFHTAARVRAALLAGLSLAVGTAVAATDTVLEAFGKLQKQITDLTTTVAGKITNPMTTDADIIVGGASGAPTRLPKGAALQVLRVNAGATALEYADPASGVSLPVVATFAGNLTLALAHINTYRRSLDATAQVVTVPAQATVAWTADAEIHIEQGAAGSVTITAAAGVTINGVTAGSFSLAGQYAAATLKRIGADAWTLIGILYGSLTTAINEAPIVTLASAATVDIGAAKANTISISGAVGITSLGTAPSGWRRTLVFGGALPLTHNATSLILPTGANITTAAGDVAEFVSLGSGNWRCARYQKASGDAVAFAYDRENILGTVSQTSGVPTGAIIEQGTNANGYYVRYADGTQLVAMVPAVVSKTIDTALFGGFRSAETVDTFPAAFIAVPTAFSVNSRSLTGFGAALFSATATTIGTVVTSITTQAASNRGVYIIAIGRWYA